MWCQVLLCVQRNFPLRLRFGMADDTCTLGRMSFNCISQRTIYFLSAAASRADPDESLFNRLSILLRHASL